MAFDATSTEDSVIIRDEAVRHTSPAQVESKRAGIEQESPAALEALVRGSRRTAPARVLLLMAAVSCMVWSGVALLSAPEAQHLVTPLQR